ncbi:MAG: type II secretion system protein GspG [Candidatus Hydrogenedentota bacterium]|nr:MAG: type II secretion system protein GspG [Candidatus Hydrogenedentota bacterium]
MIPKPRERRLPASEPDSGFTLAEILVVVVIIGILAAFVLPRFVGKTEEARLTAARGEIAALATALRNYNIDHDRFPTTDEGLEALLKKDKDGHGPYLEKTTAVPTDPWGNPYHYLQPGEHNYDYDLWSSGPDGLSGTDDDIGNWQ